MLIGFLVFISGGCDNPTDNDDKITGGTNTLEDTSLNDVEKVFTRKGYREINDDKNTQEDIKSVFLEMKRPKKLTNKNLRRNLIRNKIKSVGEEGERTDVIKTNTLKGFYERIIEKSFKDTLKEIKEKTGLDFYELEKFKLNLKDLCDRLQQEIDIDMFIDESIDSIKEKYDKLKYTDDENISMHIIIENAYKEIEGRWISESLK